MARTLQESKGSKENAKSLIESTQNHDYHLHILAQRMTRTTMISTTIIAEITMRCLYILREKPLSVNMLDGERQYGKAKEKMVDGKVKILTVVSSSSMFRTHDL